MLVEIISPDKTLFSGSLELVQLPGIDGSFEILNNHAPLVSVLGKGKLKLVDEKQNEQFIEIKGGVVEVLDNHIKILAE